MTATAILRFLGLIWKAKRHIPIRGNQKTLVEFRLKLLYQFSKTIIKCVWLRVARMEMDCNLTLGYRFQVFPLFLTKIVRNWLWFFLRSRKSFVSFLSMHFVYEKRYLMYFQNILQLKTWKSLWETPFDYIRNVWAEKLKKLHVTAPSRPLVW